MTRILKHMSLMSSVCALLISQTSFADTYELEIEFEPISNFHLRKSHQEKFGPFTFIGGGKLESEHWSFSGFSGLHIAQAGQDLLAVSDGGYFLQAQIQRSANGAPIGLNQAKTIGLLDEKSIDHDEKHHRDAEGLFVKGDDVFVSMEALDELRRYQLNDLGGTPDLVPIDIPKHEVRSNEGMEALTIGSENSSLSGAMVAFTEGSLNDEGNYFAFVHSGERKGAFFVKARDEFKVTGADFLPNGDLLLLERRFSLFKGLHMRFRLIDDADISPGKTVDGEVLYTAGLGHKIDNLEGLSIWKNQADETIVSLISDDNANLLQSTIYLEFRYDGEVKTAN